MDWDRVARLLGADTLAQLKEKKVAIIGLGSGGGFVALGLAMSGVGRFILIDDDAVESKNVVRHVADLRDVGRTKVQAVSDLIHQRNPEAEISTIKGRIEAHADRLDGVDLVVCAVDGEGPKFLINELCLRKNLAAIYAGVYERGEGGDVVLIHPYDGPCYACWAAALREGYIPPTPTSTGELDYGMINERGTLDAEPGLWLHVTRVASTQADFALNFLLRGTSPYRDMPANTVVLANHALEIIEGRLTPPYSAEWVNIPRDPHCLVCGESKLMTARQSLSLDEVGGSLVSFEEEEHDEQQQS